jgi:hypothetical protein
MKNRTPNPDQLRHSIDSGKTGDKVDFPDPAAAPLGTDDEAAGNPITQEQLDIAMRYEAGRPGTPAEAGAGRQYNGGANLRFVAALSIAGVVVIAVVAALTR